MVKVEIYIKGKQIDLEQSRNVSLTKQVNEFTNLHTRQWNYTNKISVPKTAHNKKIFNFLSYQGNTSDIQYERIEGAQMYFNGVPIIMSGYALAADTGKTYNIVINDGSVTFFEAIKGLTLQDLDWSDLDHDYGETTMENSFNNTSGYIYPVARTTTAGGFTGIAIDIPSPSVYIKDIVQKIANISGISIEGTLLIDNLYNTTVMTTEKGFKLSLEDVTQEDQQVKISSMGGQSNYTEAAPPVATGPAGYYTLIVDYAVYGDTNPAMEITVDGNSTDAVIITDDTGQLTWNVYGSSFSAIISASNPNGINTQANITLTANRINFGTVAVKFAELMPKMKLTDFIKQILVKWCCNPYPNIKESKIRFDFINDFTFAQKQNLSKYMQPFDESEGYQFGGYASENEFNYKITDEEEQESEGILYYSHNQGNKKVHFTSQFAQPKIYQGNVYYNLLFDEELEPQEGEVKLFQVELNAGNTTLTTTGGLAGKSVANRVNYVFEELKFSRLIPRYYNFLQERVFRKPIKIKRMFAFPVLRFYNLDFQKLFYLEQEASDFIINKIKMNSRGLTEAELIKVDKKRLIPTDPLAVITGQDYFTQPGAQTVRLSGTDSYSNGGYITDYLWEVKDGATVLITSTKNNITFNLPESAEYEACLTVTNEQNRTNQRRIDVRSRPPVVNEPDFFSDETLLLSDACYTLLQVKINGTANQVVSLNVKSAIINGKSNLVFWNASGSVGSNCQVTGCPLIDQIVLPKLGPGVNEVHYIDDRDYNVTLNGAGEGWLQFRIEGVKEVNSPVNNGTFVTIKDNGSGFTKTIIQRYWAKTTQCDSF